MAKSKAETTAETRQRIREQFATEPDKEELQAEIMEPAGDEVTIGGVPMRLYPLSGRNARTLMALTAQVIPEAMGPGMPAMRLGGALVEKYLDRFLPLLAAATQPAGSVLDARQLQKIQDDIDKSTQTPRGVFELAAAFDMMITQNDVMEAFEAPKGRTAEG